MGYSLKADAALDTLADLFLTEGIPEYIRSDNSFNERFNGILRDELLDGEMFYTIKEAEVMLEDFRRYYN